MRRIIVLITMLLCTFQSQATSTVSGFAVAPRWVGAFSGWGGFGKLMRYDISNGVTTKTSCIFDGQSHYVTINPDGQRLAFVAQQHPSYLEGNWTAGYLVPSAIVVMSTAGGPVDTVVPGLPDGLQRTFLDWPTGDWLFYGLGSPSTDGSYSVAGSNSGIREIWKVNVNTKQKVKISSFSNVNDSAASCFQISISNDGLKCAVRPMSEPVNNGMFAFAFSDFPGGVAKLVRGDAHDFYWYGCGVSVAPSGNYAMHISNGQHTNIVIRSWADPSVKTADLWLGTMNSWRTPGTASFIDTVGGGTDANRWSCNDDKWICLAVGWRGRNGDGGSNQVLVNWVDHEIVRTSMDTMSTAPLKTCNETGDFWVGNPSTLPVLTKASKPTVTPTTLTFKDSVRVTLTSATPGAKIYYTTNGSTPDSTNAAKILYAAPFKLTTTTTVKARAYATGFLKSDSLAVTFTKATTPVIAASRATMAQTVNVTIAVYDMLGRQLLGNETRGLGWDGKTITGTTLKRGVYFVQLRNASGLVKTEKLTINR